MLCVGSLVPRQNVSAASSERVPSTGHVLKSTNHSADEVRVRVRGEYRFEFVRGGEGEGKGGVWV